MMQTIDMSKDLDNIILQGFVQKQSRFLKSWRKRWCVLTSRSLYTFKQQRVYLSPTQSLPLSSILSIKSIDNQKQFCFTIQTLQQTFLLTGTTKTNKQQWINQIGKALVKLQRKYSTEQQE